MFLLFLSILHLTQSQELTSPIIFSDCTHLILPAGCQCYHSGEESQLRCHKSKLTSIPKLPNNMRWNALDFSSNNLTSIDSYLFSDIYVEKLDLKSNSIRTIDLTAFKEIQNLKQLSINRNQLKEFDPKILISLNMSLGKIFVNSNKYFSNLLCLLFEELLDMSHNPFGYLDLGGIFLYLSYLKEFYSVSCQLNDSSLHTLLILTNHSHYSLELIDLSYNNITSLCNNLFDNFYQLHELRLNNNNIYSIDNYFIHTLNYLRTLNLAFNSIESVPNIFSLSLEYLNLSSNNIRYLNDYFASNLRAIRLIDFDSNKHLSSISSRSFCYTNTLTLEKLSFRSNNLSSINSYSELLCSLLEKNINQNIINFDDNANLKCDCMLVEFQRYLINYSNLTCTQHGQDRYFISRLKNAFSNCTSASDICLKVKKKDLCNWSNANQLILEGTCQEKLIDNNNSTNNQSQSNHLRKNNALNSPDRIGIKTFTINYIWFFIVYLTFHRF